MTGPVGTLYLTVGLPGCGKSHKAAEWAREDPARRVMCGRDAVRRMAHGVYLGCGGQEEQVSAMQRDLIRGRLCAGVDVAVDDTNLVPEHLRALVDLGRGCGAEVVVWDMRDVPLELCLERNAARLGDDRVPEERVREMWADHIAGRSTS